MTRIRQRSGKRGQWVEKGKDVFDKSDSSPHQVPATGRNLEAPMMGDDAAC